MASRIKSAQESHNGEDLVASLATEIKSMTEVKLDIQPIRTERLCITIEGTTPLLVCAWSEKARNMILEKQTGGKGFKTKEKKVPEVDYKNSLYTSLDGWTGIPAGGLKGCLVNACRAIDGLPMTMAKRIVFVVSQGQTSRGQSLVRVIGEHKMDESMVRIDNGKTADIRFRAIYPEWKIQFDLDILANVITPVQAVNLVNLAGFIEGLCEHRPGAPKSNTGNNGRFRVVNNN